jgi:glyoxalase family protein
MPNLITPGFHHISFVSADAARTDRFYTAVMGLQRARGENSSTAIREYTFPSGSGRPGSIVARVKPRDSSPGRPGIGGIHHLAMGVADEGGLLKWKRRLNDHGVAVTGPYDRGYFTSIYFRDPDGQILEIATAGPGYTIDEPIDELGRGLMVPPQRIVVGHRDERAIAALNHDEPVPVVTADMALSGIHHITGITDDLVRAGEFYEEALGLKLIKKTTNRDDPNQLHYFWANYDGQSVAPHSAFTLFGWPSNWNGTREGLGQTDHIAFRARNRDEQLAWVDHLRSIDVETAEAPAGEGFSSVIFNAPDGLTVEIAADAE